MPRSVEAKTVAHREQIRAWRAENPPRPWRDICEALGLSRNRARVILRGGAHNPDHKNKRYRCAASGCRFTSRAINPPDRCPRCGSYRWRSKEDVTL
jgi:predicted Zn-ribbon and HTH transcriptional regulator